MYFRDLNFKFKKLSMIFFRFSVLTDILNKQRTAKCLSNLSLNIYINILILEVLLMNSCPL